MPTEALPPEEEGSGGFLSRIKPMQWNHMKALVWKNILGLVRNLG